MRKDHGRLDTIPGFLPQPRRGAARLRLRRPLRARAGRSAASEEPPLYDVGGAPRQPLPLPRAGAGSCRARRRPPTSRCRRSTAHATPLLRFDDLGKVFRQHGHDIHALAGVSAAIWPGETLGLVGESGSGKTTLARTLLGIVGRPAGQVELDGRAARRRRLAKRSREEIRALQIVFQNPDSALNRRHTVRRILRRSLKKLAGVTGARGRGADASSSPGSVRLAERYAHAPSRGSCRAG